MRRTKIVCTLGPATAEPEKIGALLDAGLDVARINFSHGSQEEKALLIARVREQAAARGRWVPIIGDLQGPKIRTGRIDGGGPVMLAEGSTVRVAASAGLTTAACITADYPRLPQEVDAGQRLLLADGALELKVTERRGAELECVVVHGGPLGERKGINVPGAALSVPSVTEKDKADLKFALEQQVDFLALSFIREPQDVIRARALVKAAGGNARLIAKLEKPQAMDHLDEIVSEADAVMVARGDLGVELSPAEVPIAQKKIIALGGVLRKPVITATQMLESMMESPRPTRAEASDVANAVFDGSDALMLSGETARGRFPVEAVEMMAGIIERAEASEAWQCPPPVDAARSDTSDAVAETAVHLAGKLGVRVITVYTESGYTAGLVSKHRPRCRVVGLSRFPEVCRRMGLLWGVEPCLVEHIADLDAMVLYVENLLLQRGMVAPGDQICLVAGTPFDVRGKTDLIKLHGITASKA